MRRLVERNGRLAFHHESIKIFIKQYGHGFGKCANDARFDFRDGVENSQSAVLKNRIGVKDEKPRFHSWTQFARRLKSRKLARNRRKKDVDLNLISAIRAVAEA